MNTMKAIIIVDMQEFFLRRFTPHVLETLVQNQLKIIKLYSKKFPLILLEYGDKNISRGKTLNKLTSNTKYQVIVKNSNSGFTETNLEKDLKQLGVKEIIIMGINANGCVQDTAMSALHRGFKVTTSFGVIANSYKNTFDLSQQNRKWFMKNTNFLSSMEDLINYLN